MLQRWRMSRGKEKARRISGERHAGLERFIAWQVLFLAYLGITDGEHAASWDVVVRQANSQRVAVQLVEQVPFATNGNSLNEVGNLLCIELA